MPTTEVHRHSDQLSVSTTVNIYSTTKTYGR